MKRKQVYIDAEQEARLRHLAAERGTSEAGILREALNQYLGIEPGNSPATFGDNPLLGIIGLVDDPDAPSDGSVSYDMISTVHLKPAWG